MRTFSVTLMQNLGNGLPGEVLGLEGKLISVGAISWEVDKELTKLAPGDLPIKISDDDGSVWAWLQGQLQTSAALYPPFLVLDISGERAFTGTVQPSQIERDERTYQISLTAQNWVSMLSAKALSASAGWKRPEPKAIASRPASQAQENTLGAFDLWAFKAGNNLDTLYFPEPMNWLVPGDLLDGSTPQGSVAGAKVLEVKHDSGVFGACAVKLDRKVWSFVGWAPSSYIGTWTRRATSYTPKAYFQVAEAVASNPDPKVYKVKLDTIDGLYPGDTLELQNADRSQVFTVAQLDPTRCLVYTRESVQNLAVGDRLYFSEESAAQMVMEDPRAILSRACSPFVADFSAALASDLSAPLFSWVPMRPAYGEDLLAVSDLEAGFSNLRVFSGSRAWDGTPESGWASASGASLRAIWSDQRATAPGSLMPWEAITLAPESWDRNEAPDPNVRNRPVKDGSGNTIPWGGNSWDPKTSKTAKTVLVYDYINMRRVVLQGAAVQINAWNGSAWGGNVSATWPSQVQSASVFPGGPSTAIVALCADGLRVAELPSGWSSGAIAVPTAAQDAVLKTTPWGCYLVGSKGYGRITYQAGGNVSLNWVSIAGDGTTLLPNTFQGVDASNLTVLAVMTELDRTGATTTETHALRLAATPVTTPTAGASVLWDEKVLEGEPILCGSVRDPSTPGRVMGHLGGRLYQVSATVPMSRALERFTPGGMHASELIEHVCQVLNLIAYPTPDGVVHFASRASSTVVPLTVDQTSLVHTRAWEHFYSIVRVSGQADSMADVYASTDGGQLLEFGSHPLIWSDGACSAMASVYAAWFGKPRAVRKESWFHTNPNAAAPWEGLRPLSTVTVNGAGPYLLMALNDDRVAGKAQATLVEV
jgi:hypothetical protein